MVNLIFKDHYERLIDHAIHDLPITREDQGIVRKALAGFLCQRKVVQIADEGLMRAISNMFELVTQPQLILPDTNVHEYQILMKSKIYNLLAQLEIFENRPAGSSELEWLETLHTRINEISITDDKWLEDNKESINLLWQNKDKAEQLFNKGVKLKDLLDSGAYFVEEGVLKNFDGLVRLLDQEGVDLPTIAKMNYFYRYRLLENAGGVASLLSHHIPGMDFQYYLDIQQNENSQEYFVAGDKARLLNRGIRYDLVTEEDPELGQLVVKKASGLCCLVDVRADWKEVKSLEKEFRDEVITEAYSVSLYYKRGVTLPTLKNLDPELRKGLFYNAIWLDKLFEEHPEFDFKKVVGLQGMLRQAVIWCPRQLMALFEVGISFETLEELGDELGSKAIQEGYEIKNSVQRWGGRFQTREDFERFLR